MEITEPKMCECAGCHNIATYVSDYGYICNHCKKLEEKGNYGAVEYEKLIGVNKKWRFVW